MPPGRKIIHYIRQTTLNGRQTVWIFILRSLKVG